MVVLHLVDHHRNVRIPQAAVVTFHNTVCVLGHSQTTAMLKHCTSSSVSTSYFQLSSAFLVFPKEY